MFTRSDLKAFQKPQKYPAVSLLAPTHRTAPANKQDRIKVKNLLTTAVNRLQKEFKKREVADVVDRLKALVNEVDWAHTLEGLALFASHDTSAAIKVPFRLKPRVLIDDSFATRDLVYTYNRTQPYRVLLLSHTARLFDGWKNVLEEHGNPFPLAHKGPGGAEKLPGGVGINRSAIRDDAMRQFYRSVDAAVEKVQKANPLPLVLVGVERNLAFYHEVAKRPEAVVGMLAGNHDKTAIDKLGKLVWPIFDHAGTRMRTAGLVQLDDAVSANQSASGIAQVWREAAADNVKSLFVEKGYKYPSDVADDGKTLQKYTGKGPQAYDDLVDEAIERVMATGGEVHFFTPGDLDLHQQIAVIRRS